MEKILVIGDSCKDVYVYGKVDRLCPDAPVPVFIPQTQTETGGMAANVYENIKSICFEADIITNSTSVTKTRYVEERTNHMVIRVDSQKDALPQIENIKSIDLSQYSCVIVSDYNKGFLTYDDIEYLCDNHSHVFIDTKKIINNCFQNAFCIKINEVEYSNHLAAGYDLSHCDSKLIVTLGHKGCRYQNQIFPVKKVEIKDMSGAGDTFMAALAVMYCKTQSMERAIVYANECATVVVQHKGVTKVGHIDKSLII